MVRFLQAPPINVSLAQLAEFGLQNQRFGVRIPGGTPSYAPIVYRLGHQVFILRSGVRLPVGVPVMARSYSGYYRGLSIRRREFDSPTSRQVIDILK